MIWCNGLETEDLIQIHKWGCNGELKPALLSEQITIIYWKMKFFHNGLLKLLYCKSLYFNNVCVCVCVCVCMPQNLLFPKVIGLQNMALASSIPHSNQLGFFFSRCLGSTLKLYFWQNISLFLTILCEKLNFQQGSQTSFTSAYFDTDIKTIFSQ